MLEFRVGSLGSIGLSAVLSASASGAFLGVTSEYTGVVDGRHVFRVFAVSNTASDVLLSAFGHNVTSGSMSGVQHNDDHGGTWVPHPAPASSSASDSFVTITGGLGISGGDNSSGVGTALSSGWTNGGIGGVIENVSGTYQGASWQSSNPQVEVRADSGILVDGMYRILIMQVSGADLGTTASTRYTAKLNLLWRTSGSTGLSYTFNQAFSIPAPGGIVLLGTAVSMCSGRRRKSA